MTSRRDTQGHCPWTVTSTAKPRTTPQPCLLSAVPPPCVYVYVRVFACVLFCVSVCVCVCFLSLLECDPRHDKTVTVCRRVLPYAHHRRSRSSDRDLQRRAQSPLPPFLLSSCPPPPYFLLMSLHVTYTSPPTCICPVSSPPAPFSFCPPHFAA